MSTSLFKGFSMDTVKEGIRLNLIELLEKSGKKPSDLADFCNVHRSAVSNWKSGKNSIDIELIPLICEFFGISIDAFFSHAEELEPLIVLSEDEKELVNCYRNLTQNGKEAVLTGLRNFAESVGK